MKMVERPWLVVVALACIIAAVVWLRSALRLLRAARRIEAETNADEAAALARTGFIKDLHAVLVYLAVAAGLGVASFGHTPPLGGAVSVLVLVPVLVAWRYSPRFLEEARLAEERSKLERRAEDFIARMGGGGEDGAAVVKRLRERGIVGTYDDAAATMRAYLDAGCQRLYLRVLNLDDPEMLLEIADEVAVRAFDHAPEAA